jgi:hypothetical protein
VGCGDLKPDFSFAATTTVNIGGDEFDVNCEVFFYTDDSGLIVEFMEAAMPGGAKLRMKPSGSERERWEEQAAETWPNVRARIPRLQLARR